jgi:dihydrodipicolinate synthase/N-acetylneuraminate lyase
VKNWAGDWDFSGIVTVLNTPFSDGGAPDLPALKAHVRYALGAGVAGFLVPAMAAEVDTLSRAERRDIVRTVVEAAGGRVPVIGGASAPREQRVGIAAELTALGCKGVLVSIPFTDEDEYRRQVLDVAAAGMDYLMLQDWDASSSGLPLELIVRLAEDVPSFRCLKVESVPAGPKYSAVKKACRERLQVAGGWSVMHLIDGLDRGVDIFMPTGLHELYVGVLRLYHGGRRDEALRWFRRLLPILTFSNQHLEVSICFFKRLLFRQGLYSSDKVRISTRFWDEFNRRRADELIDEALNLIDELKEEYPPPQV